MGSIGVPLKILYEAIGLIVTIELETGQLYRGKLISVEDNMNVQLKEVTITHRDGHVSAAEQCFLRGSHIRLAILPDNLRHAPMFKNFGRSKGRGLGMGRAREEVARAQASTKSGIQVYHPFSTNPPSVFSAWGQGWLGSTTEETTDSRLKTLVQVFLSILSRIS